MNQKTHATIWLLFDSKSFGGIESHIYQLSLGLIHHQQNVQVVFLSDYGPHPLKDKLTQNNIPFIALGGTLRSLHQAIKKHQPTVIHTHGYKAGIYGRVAAKIRSTTLVSTYHAGETSFGKVAIYDFIDRFTARLADKVFCVSDEISQRVYSRNSVFDNFVNTIEIGTSHGTQIAFVGRLSHEKAPDRFIELAKDYPQEHFHLYGDGPMRATLESHCPDNVTFHGSQSNMSDIWPKIGLLVMPSRAEGLPMAALESLAWGIPVIANNVGALKKLIKTNHNGWLISNDSDTTLAQALEQSLSQTKATRTIFQNQCQQTIHEKFSSHVTIPKLLQHYDINCS